MHEGEVKKDSPEWLFGEILQRLKHGDEAFRRIDALINKIMLKQIDINQQIERMEMQIENHIKNEKKMLETKKAIWIAIGLSFLSFIFGIAGRIIVKFL